MKLVNNYQVKQDEGILLNANESSQNIEAKMIEEIQTAIGNIAFHRYPEDSSNIVKQAYANYINKEPCQIIVGNGSDEMLGLLIGLQIKEGKKLYTLSLDFSMYDYYVGMHNGDVIKYDWEMDNEFDVDDFIKVGKQQKVDMILFSNPNNPTGRVMSQSDLCKIVEAFSEQYVIIDEAYADFDDTTMLSYVDTYPNLLVTRTLSKAFALASIRCGFLIGSKDTIAKIEVFKVPYNVNTLTQVVASVVLQYKQYVHTHIEEIKTQREQMYQQYIELNKQGFKLYPSKTNYLYGVCDNIEKLTKLFQEQEIVIRYYKDNSFRITIGTREENTKVLEVIKAY